MSGLYFLMIPITLGVTLEDLVVKAILLEIPTFHHGLSS